VREGKSPAGGCSLRARRPPPKWGMFHFGNLPLNSQRMAFLGHLSLTP
jgi:hypothetical protein